MQMSSTWWWRLLTGDLRELEYRVVRLRNRLHCRWAPKGDRDRRMLFVIGHPRTATVTLDTIFRANDVKSCHSSGRWHPSRYEAFTDRGNFQPFRLLDRTYPDSRFILNIRPAFNYLRSLATYWHSRRLGGADLVRGRLSERDARGEILRRNRHFVDVIRHFQDRDNLLVADIEEPGAFDFLCERLGLTNPGDVWKNRSRAETPPRFMDAIEGAFETLGIEDERMNPFVFRSLLDDGERALVSRFVSTHADRIHLSERWMGDPRPPEHP